MQRNQNLRFLQEYLLEETNKATSYRPDCLYVPMSITKKKNQTPIDSPNRHFVMLIQNRDVYMWIVVKKDLKKDQKMYAKVCECYKSVKSLADYQKMPICQNYKQCMYWLKNFPCQIVIFEDIFFEVFPKLNCQQNAINFHVISEDNQQIAKMTHRNRKIKNIFDDENYVLKMVKQNMQRLAIIKQEKSSIIQNQKDFQRLILRNIIFPNFIKLSKYQKSEHHQYRLHLKGIKDLSEEEKLSSKDKFIECSLKQFPDDEELIQQYNALEFMSPKDVLRFYTLDSFFYKVLNNTLRIAKNTEQFFSIGEPFKKVFDSIKTEYDKSEKNKTLIVYRGADLTNSQCQYLQQNINKYIEINGFISTSKSFETAKNFAKNRKSQIIFKIQVKPIPQKYRQFDYGYVDLQTNKCSAFEEDQVLFNALNIFKIKNKQKTGDFDVYVLEYGAIFQILDQDPNSLSNNDMYAYYAFKEIQELNAKVTCIGQVYMRTYETQKAVAFYEFKLLQLQKIGNTSPKPTDQQIRHLKLKAADAYLANLEPDKALKLLEEVLIGMQNSTTTTKNYAELLQRRLAQKTNQARCIKISTMMTQIKNHNEQYQKAEQMSKQLTNELQKKCKQKWQMELIWPKIQLLEQASEAKKTQLMFDDQFELLKKIEKQLIDALKKIQRQPNLGYDAKKAKIKLTEVYESMAQAVEKSELQKSQIKSIKSSFDKLYADLMPMLEANSYEAGIIDIRKMQILRRTDNFNLEVQLNNYQHSLQQIKQNTQQKDSIIPKIYNKIAQIFRFKQKKTGSAQAIYNYKKQLKSQIMIYGEAHPNPLKTKVDIAICQRDDKNTIIALDKFREAFSTKLYHSEKKYSIHAKALYNMAQAYTDKGEEGLALKSLQQAYAILKALLTPNDFKKSVLRFKIKLKIGRAYLSSSLRTPNSLKIAQKNLIKYHNFVIKFYKNSYHTDVGLSFSSLGILYSILKEYQKSKQNFQQSKRIYEQSVGTNSLEVAKIKSNLAICYAQLKKVAKSIKILLEAQQIFSKIYQQLKKRNPFEHEIKFIQAKIQKLTKEYDQAINSCQQSIETENSFLQSKFKNQLQSQAKVSLLQRPIQSIFMNSFLSQASDHRLKCQFFICQCLISKKEYSQAKKKLQKLKNKLIDRIKQEAQKPLFKDSVYSKKKFYLNKSQEYLKNITKIIHRQQKELTQSAQKQDISEFSQQNQIVDNL